MDPGGWKVRRRPWREMEHLNTAQGRAEASKVVELVPTGPSLTGPERHQPQFVWIRAVHTTEYLYKYKDHVPSRWTGQSYVVHGKSVGSSAICRGQHTACRACGGSYTANVVLDLFIIY